MDRQRNGEIDKEMDGDIYKQIGGEDNNRNNERKTEMTARKIYSLDGAAAHPQRPPTESNRRDAKASTI